MLDAGRPGVRLAELQVGDHVTSGRLRQELSGGEAHHHVVMGVPMPARLRTRDQAPFRDDDPLRFLEALGCGLGSCAHASRSRRRAIQAATAAVIAMGTARIANTMIPSGNRLPKPPNTSAVTN